jgi:hypothetical protein
MINLKNKVLQTESTKAIWRGDRNSTEWMDANKLYRFLFGANLGNSKCECLEDLFGFIKNKNINQKIKNKMSKEFVLITGKVLQTSKFGNITGSSSDEKCIQLLTAYPALSKHFKTLPKNWKEICSTKKVEVKAVEEKKEEPTYDLTPLEELSTKELKELIIMSGNKVPKGNKATLLEFAKKNNL